jgi:hypothetical protein
MIGRVAHSIAFCAIEWVTRQSTILNSQGLTVLIPGKRLSPDAVKAIAISIATHSIAKSAIEWGTQSLYGHP